MTRTTKSKTTKKTTPTKTASPWSAEQVKAIRAWAQAEYEAWHEAESARAAKEGSMCIAPFPDPDETVVEAEHVTFMFWAGSTLVPSQGKLEIPKDRDWTA